MTNPVIGLGLLAISSLSCRFALLVLFSTNPGILSVGAGAGAGNSSGNSVIGVVVALVSFEGTSGAGVIGGLLIG